ncbi:MAG TPA: TetR/AcrR family transcriptional regulator C-terminal domain-containing protein [Chloroflexota bacterium]
MVAAEESRWDRKHRAIMEAASALFLSQGYLGASMDDVAAAAAVSKHTVYSHFADKEQLFSAIILATTDQIDELVGAVASTLADTDDLERDLGELARRFLDALMEPDLLRLRRLVIANADRFPDLGRTWYENGFERVLVVLATSFQRLADRNLLRVNDPLLAANHFVGLALWIPVNRAMFTGDHNHDTTADLDRYARAAASAFLGAYGRS